MHYETENIVNQPVREELFSRLAVNGMVRCPPSTVNKFYLSTAQSRGSQIFFHFLAWCRMEMCLLLLGLITHAFVVGRFRVVVKQSLSFGGVFC